MAPRQPRKAPRRLEILAELRAAHDHPTATALYERLRPRLPHLSLGTVYRNLEALAAEGAIRKLAAPGSTACFDGASEAHDHARCRSCGEVADIAPVGPATAPELPAGFQLEGWRLEYIGICARCGGTSTTPSAAPTPPERQPAR